MSNYVRIVQDVVFPERSCGPLCSLCAEQVFPGEVYYDIGGQTVCRDCLPQLARQIFRPCRRMCGGEACV